MTQSHGPEFAEGENRPATALARAIEECDPDGIRKAVEAGARLDVLPDTSISPLMSALLNCEKNRGRECVELLLQLGCPIEGRRGDDPPVVSCADHFIPEQLAIKMLEILLANGADVNAKSPEDNQTALFKAVVHGRTNLVRFLMEHGADPSVKCGVLSALESGFRSAIFGPLWKIFKIFESRPVSAVKWLQKRFKKESSFGRRREYAELLTLVTGQPVAAPQTEQLSEYLQAENERFGQVHPARPFDPIFSKFASRPKRSEILQRASARPNGKRQDEPLPRYERIGVYLDLSRYNDPSFSTKRLTESFQKDIAGAMGGWRSPARFRWNSRSRPRPDYWPCGTANSPARRHQLIFSLKG
ncbi:MAG: ankyrin repeat domain-containing protein [Planctomycetes bacterium]|nr:ankyrin repeat domain-containing protein [Planctomycetota bacterium]